MAGARFSIGIDLGTTNSVLAFVSLVGDATPEILFVPQWESLAGLAEASTLPSFLYRPEEAVAADFRGRAVGTESGSSGNSRARRRAKHLDGWFILRSPGFAIMLLTGWRHSCRGGRRT